MEEKRYPQFDEEEGKDIASEPLMEPIADMRQPVGATIVHDWIDDLDWDRLPNYGPFSKEEAIARIEEAEKELDDPSKWISSEKMWESLYNKYPWLR